MVCSFENLLWYSDSFFYYGRIIFFFACYFVIVDESDAIFVFTFTVFLGGGGVMTAILDDIKWSLFSGVCKKMKRTATIEFYECWRNDVGL